MRAKVCLRYSQRGNFQRRVQAVLNAYAPSNDESREQDGGKYNGSKGIWVSNLCGLTSAYRAIGIARAKLSKSK